MLPTTEAPASVDVRLEFHRRGIGLLRESPQGQRASAAFVGRGGGDDEALRTCSCSSGRARKKACAHLAELSEQVEACHSRWGGLSWDDAFTPTTWQSLARVCFSAAPQPCSRVQAVIDRRGLTVTADGTTSLLRAATLSRATHRLLDRCGVAPGMAAATSRARLLEHLQLLQLNPHERALHDAGMPTFRQAFESSFWHRLAYHCVREYGDGGSFHPAVDETNGDFVLTYRAPGEEPPVGLVLPREAVQEALALLAARFPSQDDLRVQPVPLESIFRITASTELDIDLRPQIRVLQADGQTRYLERDEVERFRYGRLVYVRELGVLAELERPGRERRFTAPVRMQLLASQIPSLIQELTAAGDAAPVVVDSRDREVRFLREYDAVDVTPHEQTSAGYWASVRLRFGGASVSLAELLRARAEKLPFVPTPEGWIDVASDSLSLLDTLAAASDRDAIREDHVHLSARELLALRGASSAPLRVGRGASLAPLLEKLFALQPAAPIPSPAGLTSPLRDYQKIGLDWLMFLYENGLSGLLCDEMGLGKTHQVLALLLTLAERHSPREPFLVVCPTSVVSHWRDKLRAHAPGLPVIVYHGHERTLPHGVSPAVIVTSYGVLRNDVERLRSRSFSVAVFDEVQQVKNDDTLTHRAASEIDARLRIGLTGTPVENNVGELRALVDLILPGLLGTERQFAERFGPSNLRREDVRHGRLRRVLSPFVLRRLKSAVLHELPEKTEDIRSCALSTEQAVLYREALAAKAGPLRDALERRDKAVPYVHVFALLNLLKRVCDHPALALRRPERHAAHTSGKWDAFVEILNASLESGQKVIVFSQYLGMIEIFERHLRQAGIGFATLTGATRDRGDVIRRFDTDADCRVFLASLKAAGHGIDLIAGSVVIHYDRWWNAAREDQATDRAHRIGQRRAVQVFKLVTEGTLEERISRLIDDKRRLMANVVHADEPGLAKTFSREDLLDLLQPLLVE